MSPILAGIIVATFAFGLGAMALFLRSMNATVVELSKDMREIKTKVEPFWAKVQQKMSADLHHPHPRYLEMDGLLEKLEALTITLGERGRLKILLMERSTDMHPDITADQRQTAATMIHVMDLVVTEHKGSQ
jgi:hypothetical protein